MRKIFLLSFLFLFTISVFFAYDTVDSVTSGGGQVILNKDGTWQWKVQPDKYKGFNDKDGGQEVKIEKFNYTNLFRNSEKYQGKYFKVYGQVSQYVKSGKTYTVRLMTSKKKYYWEDDILITGYTGKALIEDELIEITVLFDGIGSYETISNTNRSCSVFQLD